MSLDLADIRLALHYHIEAVINRGRLFYPSYYGKWIESLAPNFKEIVLINHTIAKDNEAQHEIRAKNVSIVDLGVKPSSFLKRVARFRHYQRLVARESHRCDSIGYRVPTPLAIFLHPVMNGKPSFFLLVGNMVNATRTARISWWKKQILINYWKWDHWMLSKQANEAVAFAIGPYFKTEFPRIKKLNLFFTSTINQEDIIDRQDCCKDEVVNLLYVGRFGPEKGVDTAIEAIIILRDRKIKCRLRLAGTTGGKEYDFLMQIISDNHLNDMVEFLGFVPHGEKLNDLLDTSDIFILPSRWDGQTRALWEAMARGLPIIASRGIKSLPDLFEHKKDVYFIDPEQPKQIADAVWEVTTDPMLRKTLIRSSLEISREKTLEKSAELLTKVLQEAWQ